MYRPTRYRGTCFRSRFRFSSATSRLLAWNSPSRACALVYGSARQADSGRRPARRRSKSQSSSRTPLPRSPLYPAALRCVAKDQAQGALINSPMHVKSYAAPETEAGEFADRVGGGVGRGARRPVASYSRFSTVSGWAIVNSSSATITNCQSRRICWRGSRTKQSRRKSGSRTSLSQIWVCLPTSVRSAISPSACGRPPKAKRVGPTVQAAREPSEPEDPHRRTRTASGCWAKTAFRQAPCTLMYGQAVHTSKSCQHKCGAPPPQSRTIQDLHHPRLICRAPRTRRVANRGTLK